MQIFAKHVFVLEENFARQEFTIYLHLYSWFGTDGCIIATFARQKASHEINQKFTPSKISRFIVASYIL